MKLNSLNAISPIDGRYSEKCRKLSNYFSEESLIKYRVLVEIEYFLKLTESNIPNFKDFPKNQVENIKKIYKDFNNKDAVLVKEIEKETNHDVKAVEYFVKKKFSDLKLKKYEEFIHFGLTSQDINNTAIPLSIKNALNELYIPEINKLLFLLDEKSTE